MWTEELTMEKSHIGRYGFLIALVVMMNAGMVAQSNDTATADGPLREDMIAYIKDTSAECSTFMRPEYRYSEDVNEQRLSINGVMVAEDMRCRQCRGKCAADNLRCRSQCASDSACLVHCGERSSNCEAMCKEIFQCE
jgi:hypothetical protein